MPTTTLHRLHGALTLLNSSSDGDSIHFHPARPSDLARLADSHGVTLTADGGVQLRLEGLDAPELHHRGAALVTLGRSRRTRGRARPYPYEAAALL